MPHITYRGRGKPVLIGLLAWAGIGICACAPIGHGEAYPRLRIAFPPAARLILPEADLAVAAYSVLGRGPGQETFQIDSGAEAARGGLDVRVKPGSWWVAAQALNAAGEIVLEGQAETLVSPGIDRQLSISLNPPGRPGTLELSIVLPESIQPGTLLRLERRGPDGGQSLERPAAAETFALALVPGYHSIGLTLAYPDGSSCGLAESAKLAPDRVTRLRADFSSRTSSLSMSLSLPDDAPLWPAIHPGGIRLRGLPLLLEAGGMEDGAQARWFMEGAAAGEGTSLILDTADLPSSIRVDLIADLGGRQGSAGALITLKEATWAGDFAQAALVTDPGETQAPWNEAEACASLPSGMMALAFLDGSSSNIVLYKPDAGGIGPMALSSAKARIGGSSKRATGLALSPDGSRLYAYNKSSGWLARFAISPAGALSQTGAFSPADLGLRPEALVAGLAFSVDGGRIYLMDAQARGIHAYPCSEGDFAAMTPILSIEGVTGGQSGSPALSGMTAAGAGRVLAFSQSADTAWLIREGPDALEILDILDHSSCPGLMDGPSDICFDAEADQAYLLCAGSQAISRVTCGDEGFGSVELLAWKDQVPGFGGFRRMALSRDRTALLASDPETGRLMLWALGSGACNPIGVLGDRASGSPGQAADIRPWLGGFICAGCAAENPDAFGSALVLRRP